MYVTTAVTQKGQITLPKRMRELMGIKKYDRVKLTVSAGFIKVESTEDILDLASKIRPKKRQSVITARQVFHRRYRRS